MRVWKCKQVIDFDQSTNYRERRKEQNSTTENDR